MRTVPFSKMHGLGNDYVVVDAIHHPMRRPGHFAKIVCRRKFGVGADGLLLVLPSRLGDFRMRMFNPDGSEAEMCGNGIRCLGKFVRDHGLTKRSDLSIETIPGIRRLRLAPRSGPVEEVTVDMGPPLPVPRSFHLRADGHSPLVPVDVRLPDRTFAAFVLSVGNPHCVIFLDEEVESFPLERFGPAIERHPDFPSRTNVHFLQRAGPGSWKMRTWERGAGETMACGTGATAAACALFLNGEKGPIGFQLGGGSLRVEFRGGRLFMTGPAVEVFRGEFRTK